MAFKGLGWGALALLIAAAVVPSASTSQWNPLRIKNSTTKGSLQNELSRPGLLKKYLSQTPVTSPTTNTTSIGYPELSTIASNFDINSELVDTTPASPAPEGVGAFRFMCNAGQLSYDDPIMYPGQPGRSHLHQFYGNTGANAYSTYSSLRTSGQSTCMSPVNRSAYWMPAMLDGKGNVVRPNVISIYYKRSPTTASGCKPPIVQACLPLPNGLRFIFGRNMADLSAPDTGHFHWNCSAYVGNLATMSDALAKCDKPGNYITVIGEAPGCWDGKNLDSSDHRSHVSYQQDTHFGYYACPSTHPYGIPNFSIAASYGVDTGDEPSKWHFSSDEMVPGAPQGSTFHADWFGAWDNTVMAMWMDNCIQKALSCAAGLLGNGKAMKMYSGFSWTANPRLVPIPK